MPIVTSRTNLNYARFVMIGILAIAAVCIVTMTYRWPLMKDAQVIHYINFLMDHGFAPYRDITDMNLPGAYLIEGWGMHIFGGGDMAWRMYDFALMGTLCIAMILIAVPYDWIAGLFAGIMFSLVHTADGAEDTGERDEVMAVLITLGYALLFEAMRRRKPWIMVLFGLSLGMASSVKPTVAPLGLVLLAMAWWNLKKHGETAVSYLWCGVAGAGIASVIVFGFLFHHEAAGAFFEISRRLTPYYAGLNHAAFSGMLRSSLSPAVMATLPFALVVSVANRQWQNWERWTLLLGVMFGAFSYFVQGKGYPHHRYTLIAFMLLWIALELTLALQRSGWPRIVGLAGMTVGTLIIVPFYMHRIYLIHPSDRYTESIESDLTRLGVDNLQHKVQCFDLVDGCLTALYHLKLVQSTGSTGDILLFTPGYNPIIDYYKNQFWNDISKNPPTVMVVSNEWWGRTDSFDKINEWPLFAAYLMDNYSLAASRDFPNELNRAYRIYVRKGAELPSLSQPIRSN